jgi:hydroxymethylbilane synthase
MSDLVVATRGSPLALAQAGWVVDRLHAARPGLAVSLLPVSTLGDADAATPVSALTEVGAFVRAVQQAVLDGRADVAVHSCKDLPTAGPDGLDAVYPEREAPWDVLCGAALGELDEGSRVGTGSPRRAAQLRRLRPGIHVEEVRGNVGTRLDKVADRALDAVVLAEAGLRRLNMHGAIRHRFSLDEMVPAPAQAILAVETLTGSEAAHLVSAIDDPPTRAAAEAERTLLAETGAGCRAALGALAVVEGDAMSMTAFVEDERGPRTAAASAPSPREVAARVREALGL